MSPPGKGWKLRGKANFRSQAAPPVDALAARREWVALADAITARGGRVVCLVPEDETELTGLPYAAECGQIVEHGGKALFLLPNMGVPHRQGERALWRETALALGLEPVDLRGIWEAQGDAAEFRGRPLLFHGGRTDLVGATEASRYFRRPGVEPLLLGIREPAFHGNMAALPLPAADRILVCPEVFRPGELARLEAAFGASSLIPLTESEVRLYSTNGLPIGRDWLIPHLVPPRVRALVESLGLRVVEIPMPELCEKAGGASRCLVSVADVDEAGIRIPESLDYRALRPRLLG